MQEDEQHIISSRRWTIAKRGELMTRLLSPQPFFFFVLFFGLFQRPGLPLLPFRARSAVLVTRKSCATDAGQSAAAYSDSACETETVHPCIL